MIPRECVDSRSGEGLNGQYDVSGRWNRVHEFGIALTGRPKQGEHLQDTRGPLYRFAASQRGVVKGVYDACRRARVITSRGKKTGSAHAVV